MSETFRSRHFKRSRNPFRGFFWALKNGLPPKSQTLYLLLFAVVAFLIVGALSVLYGGWWYVAILLGVFVVVDFSVYLQISLRTEPYKTKELIIAENYFAFLKSGETEQTRMPYDNIEKIKFSHQFQKSISAAILRSSLLQFVASALIHYIVIYRDNEGKKRKLLVPIDVPYLHGFLKGLIKKARLKKTYGGKYSFVASWIKADENYKVKEEDLVVTGGGGNKMANMSFGDKTEINQVKSFIYFTIFIVVLLAAFFLLPFVYDHLTG